MLKPKILISGCLLATALGTSFAGARQVTPINGSPAVKNARHCFNFPDGGNPARLRQDCIGVADWLIDIPLNDINADAIRTGSIVARRGNSSSPTQCYVDSATLGGETGGNWVLGATTTNVWENLNFNGSLNWSVWVPANGTLHAYCLIQPKGGIASVWFNP